MGNPVGVVVFNYSAWVSRYPEFTSVTEPIANDYFTEATLYLANSPCSRVTNLAQRAMLLNMITAHIARLYQLTASGQELAMPLVGRISSATEGSVSVQTELPDLGKNAAFWAQTPYGFSFWQATAQFRTAVYRAPRPYVFPPDQIGRGPY